MTDTFTLTVALEPMTCDERVKLIGVIKQLRGVKDVETHVMYSTGGHVKEVHPKEFDYWETLIEFINRDPEIPPINKRKINAGMPVRWDNDVLTIQHPEPEWCNQRFAKTLTRLLQGLQPGARIVFEAVR
jgi:hypothetical protein